MKLLILTFILTCSSLLLGQSRYYRVEGIGGLCVASMPDSILFESANYFHFGVNNYFQMGDRFNLNACVLFSRKGTKRINPVQKYQYNNLELDLFHQLKIADGLTLKLGLATSYLLNAQKVVLDGSQSKGVQRRTIDDQERMNLYYEFGLMSELQNNVGIYFSWQRNIQFNHETVLLQDFRFGLTYKINDIRWLKNTED